MPLFDRRIARASEQLAGEQMQELPARWALAEDVVRAVDHVNAAAVAERPDRGAALDSEKVLTDVAAGE